MLLYLVNPSNPAVSILKTKQSRWNRFRVWKPLSLMVLAGITPAEWDVKIIDENAGIPDYTQMPLPDLTGITAFTSQANRAYEVAEYFRKKGVPVVMGGIHATMRLDEAMERVDSVVTGEGENIWGRVLEDAKRGKLKRRYDGGFADTANMRAARHDLLPDKYTFGSIQTTRGCPLNCSFCSVTSFNGKRYRQRPVQDVVRELTAIPEKRVLFVDDNVIGTHPDHIKRAKALFRAIAQARPGKEWFGQATINFGDDEELLRLAAGAGCRGIFIGFESPTPEGLRELGKKYNLLKNRDFPTSVRRIQRHKITVAGSFIAGLDIDEPGIGKRIAYTADKYRADLMNTLFMTPLPGTRLWDRMQSEGRIALCNFPEDWNYYTLTYPVARHSNFTTEEIIEEMIACNRAFYALPRIIRRVWGASWNRRQPLVNLIGNLSARNNLRINIKAYSAYKKAGSYAKWKSKEMSNRLSGFLARKNGGC